MPGEEDESPSGIRKRLAASRLNDNEPTPRRDYPWDSHPGDIPPITERSPITVGFVGNMVGFAVVLTTVVGSFFTLKGMVDTNDIRVNARIDALDADAKHRFADQEGKTHRLVNLTCSIARQVHAPTGGDCDP
jgi:hypothetical protein